MAATEAEVAVAFKKNQFQLQGDDVIDRCVDLTAQYGISAAELSEAYDLFALHQNAGSEVTSKTMEHFQERLKKQPPARTATAPTPARPTSRPAAVKTPPSARTNGLHSALADQSNLSHSPAQVRTPTPGKKPAAGEAADGSAAKRSRLSSTFKDRAQPMEEEGAPHATGRCAFELLGEGHLAAGQRYMVDRLEDKVAYLDGRITDFAEVLEAQGLGPPQPVSVATQAPGLFVGRVCCESGEGRLNEASVQLEGGLSSSNGARVKLDLSKAPGLRIFTGQVIGVTGVNPTGSCLLASQLHTGAAPPLHATRPDELADKARQTGGRPTSIVVAAGPFTTSADLEFEPLQELLRACEALQGGPPAALLLAGPFLDASHELVANGQLEQPFQRVFEQQVLGRIAEFSAACPTTRVLLAPSPRDVIAAPVFPTPPLARPGGCSLPDNVSMLPNPATFKIGEVVVGVVTADVMKAMATNEVARQPAGGDRMGAIATQVLTQRSYFPVFPPPPGAQLDTALAAAVLPLPEGKSPDLLVLPSDLAAFAKHLPAAGDAKVVCVNPGRLAKGVTGGSWAHLQLRVAEEARAVLAGEAPATNAPVPNRVDQRCRVDIKRI